MVKLKSYVYKKIYKNPFDRALNRINYFAGVIDDEYTFLQSIGYNLPPFVQVPFNLSLPEITAPKKKTSTIIFGNSKNKGNNHLDILHLFRNSSLPADLKIKILFSYGPEGTYTDVVRSQAIEIPQIDIIEEFLPKDQFALLYEQAAAFIFNGYRQMALGNIFTAICCGVKVYLSERNIVYSWLKRNKITVYSIESNLEIDLVNDDIYLPNDIYNLNITYLRVLFNRHSIRGFNARINEILK